MTEEVEKDLVEMLIDNNCAMRKAGNELAIAAMRVVNEYDGVHRLALAVSEWSKVIANEGKRGGEFYEGFDWDKFNDPKAPEGFTVREPDWSNVKKDSKTP